MNNVLLHILLVEVASMYALQKCPPTNCSFGDKSFVLSQTAVNRNEELYLVALIPLHINVRLYSQGGVSNRHIVDPVQLIRSYAFEWALKSAPQRLGINPDIPVRGIILDSDNEQETVLAQLSGIERCSTSIHHHTTQLDRRLFAGYLNYHTHSTELEQSLFANAVLNLRKPVFSLTPHVDTSYIYYRSASDDQQLVGILSMISSLEGRYVITVYSKTDNYIRMHDAFTTHSRQSLVCVTHTVSIEPDADSAALKDVVTELHDVSSYRFVVLFVTDDHLQSLLGIMSEKKGPESVVFSLLPIIPDLSPKYRQILYNNRVGALLLEYSPSRSYYNHSYFHTFMEYIRDLKPNVTHPLLEPLFEFWKQRFKCADLSTCLEEDNKLSDSDVSVNVADVISAVDVLIYAIHQSRMYLCGNDKICEKLINWTVESRNTIYNHIAGIKPYDSNIELGRNTDPYFLSAVYRVLQLVPQQVFTEREFIQVGTIEENGKYVIEGPGVYAYDDNGKTEIPISSCPKSRISECLLLCSTDNESENKTTPTVNPSPLIDLSDYYHFYKNPITLNLPLGSELSGSVVATQIRRNMYGTRYDVYGQVWVIPLGILIGLGILIVVIFEITIIFRTYLPVWSGKIPRKFVKLRTFMLSQLLLLAILLSFLTLISFMFVPTSVSCGVSRFGVGFCYAACFTVLIVKLLVILKSKTAHLYPTDDSYTSPNYLKGTFQMAILLSGLAVQVAIDVQWLIQIPAGAVLVRSYSGNPVWICNHFTWSTSYRFWDMSNFVRTEFVNHVISLAFISILLIITVILSWKTWNIPTNLQESRFIMYSVLLSIPIWITWQMLGGIIYNIKHPYAHEIADASIAFGLLIVAIILLFCMFLPKVRQLTSAGMEGVYPEDDHNTTVHDGNITSVSHNASQYLGADDTFIHGRNDGLSSAYLDTSFTTAPLPVYRSPAYSSLDRSHVRRIPSYLDKSHISVNKHGDSSIIHSDHHSDFAYDQNALRIRHPRSERYSTMCSSTPSLNRTVVSGALMPMETRTTSLNRPRKVREEKLLNRSKTLTLTPDLTGKRYSSGNSLAGPSTDINPSLGLQKSKFTAEQRSRFRDKDVGTL